MSFAIRLVRQWVAGETLDSAISRARTSAGEGIGAIINYLGEHVRDRDEVEDNVAENLRALEAIGRSGLKASLSIKLTQIGLAIDRQLCTSKLEQILESAASNGIFVWVDMEGSSYTDDIIGIYLGLLKKYRNIGIAIQANLRRSEADVHRITAAGGRIRLVKGAYPEKADIAFTKRSEVAGDFAKLVAYLLYASPAFAIGSHDDVLIRETIAANTGHNKKIEFQMLMGIRTRLKRELVWRKLAVADYIPYGKDWIPYTMRRIRERRSNLLVILRSIFDL